MPFPGATASPADPSRPTPPAPAGWAGRWAWVGIVGAGLAAYGNSFSGRFVFLDGPAILDNPTIRRLWPIGQVLSPPSDGGLTVGGRPLVNLSLALNYAISGTKVWSYHAFNLAVHLAAALVLFDLLRRTVQKAALRPWTASFPTALAFAVALLWTVHPLQTESVTYVIQRAESLMGLFYLLTLYCFVRGSEVVDGGGPAFAPRGGASAGEKAPRRRSLVWFGLSWLACLFGMASKEVMVSAPLLVLLYDRTFCSGSFREAWRRHGRLFGALAGTWLLLGYLVISTGGNRGGTSGFGTGFSWGRYALTQFPAVLHYLRLAAWPHPLNFYSGAHWVGRVGEIAPQAAAVLLLLAGTVAALVRAGGERDGFFWRPLGWAGAFFFAILAPTSLLPGMSQTMAEHRMYLALAPVLAVGIFGVFSGGEWLVARAGGGRGCVLPGLSFCLLAAVACGDLTRRRNELYHSDLALWAETARQSPADPYVQNNLGIALIGADRLPEAALHFQRAVELKPDYAEAENNLGLVLAQTGRLPDAISRYEEALRSRPTYSEAEANLGVALAGSGRAPEAIRHLQEALRLKPDYAEARNDLAVVLAGAGRLPEAIEQYQRVLGLTPGNPEVQYNLANALAQTGRPAEAVEHYQEAVRLKPDYPEALANLGAALAGLGRLPEAVAQDERALRLDPDDPDVRYNLGLALRALGRTAEADAQLARASRLRSGPPPAKP